MASEQPAPSSADAAPHTAPPAASRPTPDQLRAQAPLLIGAVITALLVLVFLGGMLIVTVNYLMSAPQPPF